VIFTFAKLYEKLNGVKSKNQTRLGGLPRPSLSIMVIYNILYFIAFVFYLPVLLVRGKLHGGFVQRLGFVGQESRYRLLQKSNIWFHAVSVGEVLAIVGLVERIRVAHPDRQVVITTVTKTGYALARKRFKKEDVVLYAPLDFSWSVRAFIKAIKPEIFVVAETELWPNLLTALGKVDVPMVMVNGRISDGSYFRYLRFPFIFQNVVRRFRGFCMQSTKDADRIIHLGGLAKNTLVVGSMKFDDIISGESLTPGQLGFYEDSLVLVAGSTHPGEEKIVLEIFKKLKVKFPRAALIIAPRHIERTDEVCGLALQAGYSAKKFSMAKSSSGGDDVMVVDTIGHLKALYQLASVVFVGKSLVGHGGQNIIEPAFFSKPIIVGPNMENFADIMDVFLTARGIVQVQDATELEDAVYRFFSSSEMCKTFGERARLVVEKNRGATANTQKFISQVINTAPFARPS
jgi:3-deoxy-D-manno-octulosonic-acid transferase